MNEIKTTTKNLEPGKWRFQVQAGQQVTRVRIRGQRGRLFDLQEADKLDFHSRLMKRPNGEVSEAAVLRGVPSLYLHDGPYLMLWPSPAHNWQIEYQTTPRVK